MVLAPLVVSVMMMVRSVVPYGEGAGCDVTGGGQGAVPGRWKCDVSGPDGVLVVKLL